MAEKKEKSVKVIATKRGEYPVGQWRDPGSRFEVPESKVSKNWMEIDDGKSPAKPPVEAEEKPEAETEE